ncbi:MAG: DUF1611 domain-containing protein [Candidatus Marinimicrobia bacterium]|nr:DUF1611 domain-containing protein [Candidatus Neomarinimicrobiota bacterium]
MKLNAPYLILIGAEKDSTYAKTGFGLVQWRPELVAGQLRFSGCRLDLGVPDMTVEEAVSQGVRSLIIGVAPIGGIIPDNWWDVIIDAAHQELDIVNGLHIKLKDHPKVVAAASQSGSRLIDIRVPPQNLPVGTGIKRSGKRLLTVATDCACGKKYTALAIDKAMGEAGMNSTFRATGQTGIMIAGEGIPIDAIKADFISGAAETLSPDNSPDHWDVIEGQGSLFHPGYAGVSLGLLHGSQPDAFVVCHDATRKVISGWEHYSLPSIRECIDLHLRAGRRTNPDLTCVGVSINTSGLATDMRENYLNKLQEETGLPCIDPLIEGCGSIIETMRNKFNE